MMDRHSEANIVFRPGTFAAKTDCTVTSVQDLINAGIVVSSQVVERNWGQEAVDYYVREMADRRNRKDV